MVRLGGSAARLLASLGLVAAICAIAYVSTSGYGNLGKGNVDLLGVGLSREGRGVSPAAASLSRLAAAARQTDDTVLPPRRRRAANKEVHRSVELDPLAVLSVEATRAERDEEAARQSADEAHSRVAGMSQASVRESALEGDALRRATKQDREARESAQSNMSSIAAAQPAASEAARKVAMEKKIAELKTKTARFKEMAKADEKRAEAYVESAQSSVRGMTLAQERSEIMADAPFDRSAERVYDMLRQLEETQARLKKRTESAAARAGQLEEEAKHLEKGGEGTSQEDANAAKEALASAKGEAAEAHKRAALAKRSAGMMALEHSAMRKALGSVEKARGRFEGAEGALQLAEEAAKRRKEAEAKSRKEVGEGRTEVGEGRKEVAATGANQEVGKGGVMKKGGDKNKAGGAVTAQEEKEHGKVAEKEEGKGGKTAKGEVKGSRRTGLAWPQKIMWPKQKAAVSSSGVLDAKEEESVYRHAYGDAFKEAFRAVFGPKGVLGSEAAGAVNKAGKGTRIHPSGQAKAATRAALASAKIDGVGETLKGSKSGGEGRITSLSSSSPEDEKRVVGSKVGLKRMRMGVLRDGDGELAAQFRDRNVVMRKEGRGLQRMGGLTGAEGPILETALERREGRGDESEREGGAIVRGGERVEGREHGRVWRFRNPRVDVDERSYAGRGRRGGGDAGYVLVPEREWDAVRGGASFVRIGGGEEEEMGREDGERRGLHEGGVEEEKLERRGRRHLGDFEV